MAEKPAGIHLPISKAQTVSTCIRSVLCVSVPRACMYVCACARMCVGDVGDVDGDLDDAEAEKVTNDCDYLIDAIKRLSTAEATGKGTQEAFMDALDGITRLMGHISDPPSAETGEQPHEQRGAQPYERVRGVKRRSRARRRLADTAVHLGTAAVADKRNIQRPSRTSKSTVHEQEYRGVQYACGVCLVLCVQSKKS